MAESKYDITGKSVQLPGGGTFDFHWRLGGVEGGEGLAENGMGPGAFVAKVREVCDVARVLDSGYAIPNGSLDFAVTTLMHLYRRVDGLLHMVAVTQEAGPALIERAVANVDDWDRQFDQVSDATYRAIQEARERAEAARAGQAAEAGSGQDATADAATGDAGEEG